MTPEKSSAGKKTIRVLIVDDSPMFRRLMIDILQSISSIEIVAAVGDPYEAKGILMAQPVDVMTLDIEMPRMDGLTFLNLVMEHRPMPVIMLSSLTQSGSQTVVEALLRGAFDVLGKPQSMGDRTSFTKKLVNAITSAAESKPQNKAASISVPQTQPTNTGLKYHPRQIIALGASTGGTMALREVLSKFPKNVPPIVMVQHIPACFSGSFSRRLDSHCQIEVREAQPGDYLEPGLALLAPGDQHMEIDWDGNRYRVRLNSNPKVEHQRPSVDVLFESLAKSAGTYTVAALLTGMGHDGAKGMKMLHDLKAHTIAQNEASCVVYGMSRKAVELGAADEVVSLESIAQHILKSLEIANRQTA